MHALPQSVSSAYNTLFWTVLEEGRDSGADHQGLILSLVPTD